MMKNTLTLTALMGLAALGTAQENCATLKFLGTGPGQSVKMSYNAGNSFQSVFGGVLRMKLDNQGDVREILGYCADVKTRMATGPTCVTPTTTAELGARGAYAAHLVNKYAGGILNESNSQVRNDKAMALQVVVWEALTETSNTLNISGGSFRAKSASGNQFTVAQKAFMDQYLADQGQSVADYYKSALDNCDDPVSQSVLAPVPEPATLGALTIGVLTALRRRKNRA